MPRDRSDDKMPLTNSQRADLLRYAIKNASLIPNGLFEFRLAVFEALEGSSIDPDKFTDLFAPPGKPLGSGRWQYVDAVPSLLERCAEEDIRALNMVELLTYG